MWSLFSEFFVQYIVSDRGLKPEDNLMIRWDSLYSPDADSNVNPRKNRTPDIVPMEKPNPKDLEKLEPRKKADP